MTTLFLILGISYKWWILLGVLMFVVLSIWYEIKHAPMIPYDDMIKTHGPKAMTPEDLKLEKEIDETLKDKDALELHEQLNEIINPKTIKHDKSKY